MEVWETEIRVATGTYLRPFIVLCERWNRALRAGCSTSQLPSTPSPQTSPLGEPAPPRAKSANSAFNSLSKCHSPFGAKNIYCEISQGGCPWAAAISHPAERGASILRQNFGLAKYFDFTLG